MTSPSKYAPVSVFRPVCGSGCSSVLVHDESIEETSAKSCDWLDTTLLYLHSTKYGNLCKWIRTQLCTKTKPEYTPTSVCMRVLYNSQLISSRSALSSDVPYKRWYNKCSVCFKATLISRLHTSGFVFFISRSGCFNISAVFETRIFHVLDKVCV